MGSVREARTEGSEAASKLTSNISNTVMDSVYGEGILTSSPWLKSEAARLEPTDVSFPPAVGVASVVRRQ